MQSDQAISELRSYAGALLAEAGSQQAYRPNVQEVGRVAMWRSPRFVLASLGFVAFGNIGMAAATDSAVPGDLLYPVDRAYESIAALVGIDTDRHMERLEEASVLLARGEFDLAVDTMAGAAASIDDDAGEAIDTLANVLADTDAGKENREVLHLAIGRLDSVVRGALQTNDGDDLPGWRAIVDRETRAIAAIAFANGNTPPGLEDKEGPPAREDREVSDGDRMPAGLDTSSSGSEPIDRSDIEPTGLGDSDGESTPQGQSDGVVPPGQENGDALPGLGQGRGSDRGIGA